MSVPELLDVDPSGLRLPPSRWSGADVFKLHRQIARFGDSTTDIPHLIVFRASDGELVIYDGVTRATRAAKLSPGQTVPVEVIGNLPSPAAGHPKVGERLK